jgi:hypothetical protein
MTNVLLAFSRRNSKVGYLQGLNFIVRGVLDAVADEEDTFWVFCYLLEECFSISCFINLQSLGLDCLVFQQLLQSSQPKLADHILRIKDFRLENVVFQWFLCLFSSSSLSPEYQNRILDYFILGETLANYKCGLQLMVELAPALFQAKEIDQLYTVFKDMSKYLAKLSPAEFIKRSQKIYINPKILEVVKVSNKSKLEKLGKDLPVDNRNARKTPCTGLTVTCRMKNNNFSSYPDYWNMSVKTIVKNTIYMYFSNQNTFWESTKKYRLIESDSVDNLVVHRTRHNCVEFHMLEKFKSFEKPLLVLEEKLKEQRQSLLTDFHKMFKSDMLFAFQSPEKDFEDCESVGSDSKTIKKRSIQRLIRMNSDQTN